MRHLVYLGLLVGCLAATLPLELLFGARVYRRWRQAVAAVLPVAVVFLAWDAAAVRARWWTFDPDYVLGRDLVARLPIEEVLFFLVVPVCALLTFESVRVLHPGWLPVLSVRTGPAPTEPVGLEPVSLEPVHAGRGAAR